jgi:hypothetical protein
MSEDKSGTKVQFVDNAGRRKWDLDKYLIYLIFKINLLSFFTHFI